MFPTANNEYDFPAFQNAIESLYTGNDKITLEVKSATKKKDREMFQKEFNKWIATHKRQKTKELTASKDFACAIIVRRL